MAVQVHPFAAGLGADISGVDIREPLSTADRDAIRKAWLDNLVLRFRGMPMTDAQHMAFTRQLGELEFNPAVLIAKQYGVNTQTDGRKSEIPPHQSSDVQAALRSRGLLDDRRTNGGVQAGARDDRRRDAGTAA